jgi:hypothetical protein
MSRQMKRRMLFALAALAVVAVVLVALLGSGSSHSASSGSRGATGGSRELAAAATYLGVSRALLRRELRTGHSLASVAAATAGKSPSGLLEAIVAARRSALEKLRAAGVLNAAEEQRRLARLRARVISEVAGTPRQAALTSHDMTAAAAYLGAGRARLTSELASGTTLARIAAGTPGRSAAGMIDALVGERRALLDAEVAADRLSPARRAAFLTTLRRRVTALVNRTHPTAVPLPSQR